MQIGKQVEIKEFPRVVPFKLPKTNPATAPQRVENWPTKQPAEVPVAPERKEHDTERNK